MKKFKVLILILVVIILTGCTGNYNITINNDLTVNEDAEFIVLKKNNDKISKLLTEKVNKNDYSIEELANGTIRVKVSKKYSSFGEYISSSILYNELFDSKRYSNDKKSIYFVTGTKMTNKSGENITNSLTVDNIKVTLSSSLNMIESNADIIEGNKYIWNITNKDTSKNILFKYSLTKDSANYKSLIGIIVLIVILVILIKYYDKFKSKYDL